MIWPLRPVICWAVRLGSGGNWARFLLYHSNYDNSRELMFHEMIQQILELFWCTDHQMSKWLALMSLKCANFCFKDLEKNSLSYFLTSAGFSYYFHLEWVRLLTHFTQMILMLVIGTLYIFHDTHFCQVLAHPHYKVNASVSDAWILSDSMMVWRLIVKDAVLKLFFYFRTVCCLKVCMLHSGSVSYEFMASHKPMRARHSYMKDTIIENSIIL